MARPSPFPVLAALLVGLGACSRQSGDANLVIFGSIWTGDSTHPEAKGIAVRGDSIVAVGDSAAVAHLVGMETKVLFAGTGLVIPGFADSHVYFTDRGLQLFSIDLHDASSPAEFIQRIKTYAALLKPGEWILGGKWDHERWPGAPLPDKRWIDSVTPVNPVFIQRIDGHTGLANSRALDLAEVSKSTGDVSGGTIVRDSTGAPTGILRDEAMQLLFAAVPPPGAPQADSLFAHAMAAANRNGVVAVSLMSSAWWEVAAAKRAHANGTQTVRLALYPPLAQWHAVADSIKAGSVGNDWVRIPGVKGSVDGSLGSTTALFFEPYLDAPTERGLMVTQEDSLRRWVGSADSAGLQVSVHAIGDRANALLLDIYDSVAKSHSARDRRFRIEHVQHLRAQDVGRLSPLGVLASMQPGDVAMDGQWAAKRLRPEQLQTSYAFRSLLDAKTHLLFGAGSDWLSDPPNPLLGIWAAVTRETLDGKNPVGWIPAQKITVEDALRAYTSGNAWGTFSEQRRGTLQPGKLADLVILDRDIRKVPPDSIRTAGVRTTVVGGRVVYQH